MSISAEIQKKNIKDFQNFVLEMEGTLRHREITAFMDIQGAFYNKRFDVIELAAKHKRV